MIRGYQASHPPEAPVEMKLRWGAAVGAGLIGGLLFLLVPHGSPWSGVTFFSPMIMGRAVPPTAKLALPLVWAIHLGLAILYGVVICAILSGFRRWPGIFVGGLIGLGLYGLNYGAVNLWLPQFGGSEVSVLFTHVVFGLIVAGAYEGLRRHIRQAAPVPQA